MRKEADFSDMVGERIVHVEGLFVGSEDVTFRMESGRVFTLTYYQDCCASCDIADIETHGELRGEVLAATEDNRGDAEPTPDHPDSWTWVFYNLRTEHGHTNFRWLGESNGYYSETATFEEVLND